MMFAKIALMNRVYDLDQLKVIGCSFLYDKTLDAYLHLGEKKRCINTSKSNEMFNKTDI